MLFISSLNLTGCLDFVFTSSSDPALISPTSGKLRPRGKGGPKDGSEAEPATSSSLAISTPSHGPHPPGTDSTLAEGFPRSPPQPGIGLPAGRAAGYTLEQALLPVDLLPAVFQTWERPAPRPHSFPFALCLTPASALEGQGPSLEPRPHHHAGHLLMKGALGRHPAGVSRWGQKGPGARVLFTN